MAAAVASANSLKIEASSSVDRSPSARSEAASDSPLAPSSAPSDSFDRVAPVHSNSAPSPSKQLDSQSLRSEEYRQLFRLPPEEVLIQDFNCALQENFLLQGHMYLFVHYICFYSNLFGYETKKIISFHEITSVRKAKAAAIFPTAIEILAGGKKYFFTSFLSRDEAFRIINNGWLQHGDAIKGIMDQQELRSEIGNQENGNLIVETEKRSEQPVVEMDFTERNKDVSISEDSKLLANGKGEIAPASSQEQDNVEMDAEVVPNFNCSSSVKSSIWEPMDCDAPEVPADYTMVAEMLFPIKVEEFFILFFSDDAVDFVESYHRKSGDIDFRCSSWYPEDKFGHARDVSFKHPIKIYFGARFGSCQEVQKYRVYRNSHLVIESKQEVRDVPYGDYFHVQSIWDVKRDGDESKECCILRVYVNVVFSKKTMFKGKIVQSTVEESREACATWMELAHELLKQKNLESKEEAGGDSPKLFSNDQVHLGDQVETTEHSQRSNEESELRMPSASSYFRDDICQQVGDKLQGSLSGSASTMSLFKDYVAKLFSSLKSQSQVPLFVVAIVAVILLLMQISIVFLLARPLPVHVILPADLSTLHTGLSERKAEITTLLDKQVNHLKDEMLLIETMLEKMRHDIALMKVQLRDFEVLRKQQT